MYNDKIIDEFQNPKNVGILPDANAHGVAGNVKCGDVLNIYLKIEDDIIKDISFQTFGCVAAIASGSMVTQMIKGKTIKEALEFKNSEIVKHFESMPPQKIHCSVLAEDAIKDAINNYYKNKKE